MLNEPTINPYVIKWNAVFYLKNKFLQSNIKSAATKLTGKPQGSVLGPMLFNIAIYNLGTPDPEIQRTKFAIDSNIIKPGTEEGNSWNQEEEEVLSPKLC